MSLPKELESFTVNEHNPLSCLRICVKMLQRSARSGYCAKQRKVLEKSLSGMFTLEVSNMWTGLSAWLARHLRVKIEMKLHHLLRDTIEFVDDFKHLHWQDGMRMVKIDIKEFTCQVNQVSSHTFARSSSVMKLRIFNSWLQELLIGSAELNFCSRNSFLTSPAELREGLAWVHFTVVKYLTMVSGSLLKGGC